MSTATWLLEAERRSRLVAMKLKYLDDEPPWRARTLHLRTAEESWLVG
jgi:hypothetical protein